MSSPGRSKLNPALRDAPPVPLPEHAHFSAKSERVADAQRSDMAEFNLTTGEEKMIPATEISEQALQAAVEAAEDAKAVAGDPGFNTRFDGSDLGQGREQRLLEGDQNNASLTSSVCTTYDYRVARHNTWEYPWSTQCKLYMTFPNGGVYVGAGTLIGRKHVLTAGYNLYSAALGGWARHIEVIPGLDGYYKPFGSAWATSMRTYTDFIRYGDMNLDIGLITLGQPIGDYTGTLGYGYFPDRDLWASTTHIAGYPVDLGYGRTLYYDYGWLSGFSYYRLYFNSVGTSPGENGAGMFLNRSGNYYVFAVNDVNSCPNSGCRINYWTFWDLRNWIASGS
jgi:V8-like Glu-specific endopeptidase